MCVAWILPATTCISPDFAGRAHPSTTLESCLCVPTYPCLGKKPAKLTCVVLFPLSSNTLLGLAALERLIRNCAVKNYH